MYNLSSTLVNNKVFLIKKSEVRYRIDPIYFKSVNSLKIINNTRFRVKKLTDVAIMQRGRFGHRPRNDPRFYDGDYPFIQTGDVVKASGFGGKIQFTQTLNELGLKTSRLFDEKVMVITIAANIGYTAILDFPACFPDSLISIKPKNEDVLDLQYLNVYFKFLQKYLNDLAPQAAQKNINYQQLSPTPIVVPTIEVQKEIVNIYYKALDEKHQKEQQAKELLKSIDIYLLQQLGIELPVIDTSFSNRVFTVQWSELSGERFDAFSFFNQSLKIEGGIFPNKKLISLATVNKGQSITSSKVIDGDYPVIAGGKSSPYSHNVFNYEGKTITISASGAYSGYVWYHDTKIFASDCSVIKLQKDSPVTMDYLSEILKLKQQEIYGLQQGAGQPHVYPSDLVKLNIPVPSLKFQQEIVQHIFDLRTRAKALKFQAKKALEDVKISIEQMILG